MPLQRRIPKRGFTNIFRKEYAIVNVADLNRFGKDASVDAKALVQAGLVKRVKHGIKLLGEGEIAHPLVVQVHRVSRSAREKIEAAGGRVEVI